MIGSLWRKRKLRTSMLKPLTPAYLTSAHESYVLELVCALDNPKILNIALSGSYGIGKSSILKRFIELYSSNVVEISLSTLAPITTSEDDDLPRQATTPTNQIQREIVKQLLYREPPRKTPGSRFRRIERFHWWRELIFALIVGTAFSTISLLAGWTDSILEALPALSFNSPWKNHLFVLGIGFALAVFLRRYFYGRLDIKQVTTGAATITLDEKSVSYFDQYLDEIIYFFEISGRKTVIFEDIDRFNDAHIFETLRSLNSLLNSSPQVKGPIRFIYAIRDSIFDPADIVRQGRSFQGDIDAGGDPAQLETTRSNRTKFFDLIIPVVPFITHRSARDLTASLLGDVQHSIDRDLVDLASRFVPDMRLLKNVRNEFLVFRERILSGDGEKLRLGDSQLFAMMLYKSTYLADFEAIRVGKSNLDKLYESSRKMVAAHISRLNREVVTLQQELAEGGSLAPRLQQLGKKFTAYVKLAAASAGYSFNNAEYLYNGNRTSEEDLHTEAFWRDLIDGPKDFQLVWNRRGYGQQLTFSRDLLQHILGPLDLQAWAKLDKEKNLATQEQKRAELRFIRSADIKDLMSQDDLTVDASPGDKSFDALARSIFGDGLAYQLLRHGYIDRDFILYTGTFYGNRVSTAATNFIIHHLDRDSRDEDFELVGSDIDAIIRERPHQLSDPALYNIDFLDYVLESKAHNQAAKAMVTSLARLGKEQREFLQSYLGRGTQRLQLIRRMAPLAPNALAYLAEDIGVEPEVHRSLFSAALASLGSSTSYVVNEAVGNFIAANYAEMDVLISGGQTPKTLERVVDVISRTGLQLSDLRMLSEIAVSALVKRSAYEINAPNLRVALGDDELLPLDLMREPKPEVYRYASENLETYLSSIEGIAPSVQLQQNFAAVIRDVASNGAMAMRRLVEQASELCVISDLREVPEEHWSTLASAQRVEASAENVAAYLDWSGEVDEALARALNRPEAIADAPEIGEEERAKVAYSIISARGLLSGSARARLCESLNLDEYLDSSAIEPEEGEFFADLVEKRVIQDGADTYARLKTMSWNTKELYISRSVEFSNYVSPGLVGGDLAELLRSQIVPSAVKEVALAEAAAYADASDKEGLLQLGTLAAKKGVKVAFVLVEALAKAGFDARSTLKLLGPHLTDISVAQVSVVLQSLEGSYADITSVGTDRPKLPATPEIVPVLEFLMKHAVVNSYTVEGDNIRVHKKHR